MNKYQGRNHRASVSCKISQRQTTWTIIPDKDTIKSADEPKYDTDKERDGEVGGTKKGERNIKGGFKKKVLNLS